jgi:hypothetical protein
MQHTLNRFMAATAAVAASLSASAAFCAVLIMLPDVASFYSVNSDALYLPILFRDFDTAGLGAMASWNFTPSPYFFPDMLIYAVADGLTDGFRQEIFLYAILQIWLFSMAGWLVCRELTMTAFVPYMIGFWLVMTAVVFGGYAVAGLYAVRWYIGSFLSGHHFGALITSLFAFDLAIVCILRRATATVAASAVALAILTVAAIVSDLIFVPYFCIPALTVVVVLALTREHRRRAIAVSVLVAVSMIAGYGLSRMISPAAASYLTSIKSGSNSLAAFWSVLISNTGAERILSAFVLITAAAAGVAALRCAVVLLRDRTSTLPSRQGLGIFAIFAATASIGIIIVAIGTRVFMNLSSIRYLLPLAFLPPLWLTFLMAGWIGSLRGVSAILCGRRGLAVMMVLGVPCALWVAWWSIRTPLGGVLKAPPALACFDRAERTAGLAGYWQAKPLMLFSDDKVHAVQVDASGAPMLWINNNGWYTGNGAGSPPNFSFILMDDLNEQAILARYGAADWAETCGSSRIWHYGSPRKVAVALLQDGPLRSALGARDDLPPYRPGQVLDFSLGQTTNRSYRAGGWSITDPWGIWTIEREAQLILPTVRTTGGALQLRVQARSFLTDKLPRQEVEVVVNDRPVAEWEFTPENSAGERMAVIPAEVMELHEPLQVAFRVPTAMSPAELGMSIDARRLGIGLQWLRLDPIVSDASPPG